MTQELVNKIALTKIEGVGGVIFRQLLNTFGTAEKVFAAKKDKLLKVQGVGEFLSNNIQDNKSAFERAEEILIQAEKEKVDILSIDDTNYPERLRNIYDAPALLYLKGQSMLNHPKTLGIVGTRQASEYGKSVIEKLLPKLAELDIQIISGMAYGIDICSHKLALENGLSTVGVMANGLDMVYPTAHKKTALEMLETGALVSENSFGVQPVASLFLARNRIIAGLSDCVLVVESGKKGGSMVTAEHGNTYNKEVYSVPGSLHLKYSEGTNLLIQQHKARIYISPEEMIENMNWELKNSTKSKKENSVKIDLSDFDSEEISIINLLQKQKDFHIDNLSWESGFSLNKVASVLLQLEFKDIVKALPGKKFSLK
jgi:DNA processing protein